MTGSPVDWRDLREFKAVDLTQSVILSWELGQESLLIDIDLYLLPGHVDGFFGEIHNLNALRWLEDEHM